MISSHAKGFIRSALKKQLEGIEVEDPECYPKCPHCGRRRVMALRVKSPNEAEQELCCYCLKLAPVWKHKEVSK